MAGLVRRAGWASLAVLALAIAGAAQMPHGGMGGGNASQTAPIPRDIIANREQFGIACGIADTSRQSAMAFRRTEAGQWTVMDAKQIPVLTDSAAARVWREGHWMVDIHDGSGRGKPTIHSGQICYDPQGRITQMVDRYMEMASCGCMRFTALSYAQDGRMTRKVQRFVNIRSGEEISAPETAKDFPPVWEYRRIQQLPFYSLVK